MTALRKIAEVNLPTHWAHFRLLGFESMDGERTDEANHRETALALVLGDIHNSPPLVRIHSQCLTGDVFHSLRCDCRAQLELSLKSIAKAKAGVVLYLPQEGRGIGLINKLKAYQLQDAGLDTVEANRKLGFADDSREYQFAADALKALGMKSVRLLSNNPDKVQQLEAAGVKVAERVPCRPRTTKHNAAYLKTKRTKMGHLLEEESD